LTAPPKKIIHPPDQMGKTKKFTIPLKVRKKKRLQEASPKG
jgi:hypothetical protein